jgi:hypothetical protein
MARFGLPYSDVSYEIYMYLNCSLSYQPYCITKKCYTVWLQGKKWVFFNVKGRYKKERKKKLFFNLNCLKILVLYRYHHILEYADEDKKIQDLYKICKLYSINIVHIYIYQVVCLLKYGHIKQIY